MGRQDRKHKNSQTLSTSQWSQRNEVVFSDDGFPRYGKRFKVNGARRYGQFSMRPENRDTTGVAQKQFNTRRGGRRSVGRKKVLRNKNRAD